MEEKDPKIKKTIIFKIIKAAVIFLVLTAFLILSINIYILNFSRDYIYDDISNIPQAEAVLILGASVYADGRLSDILKDRVLTAYDLYQNGRVKKVLVSGYYRDKNYNEVNSIKDYLSSLGMAEEDMLLDYSGYDTYDSIYRAKNNFKINSITITTQNYHLPRAIYIGRNLGLDASGLNSDRQAYQKINLFILREYFARFKAFLDVLSKAQPGTI